MGFGSRLSCTKPSGSLPHTVKLKPEPSKQIFRLLADSGVYYPALCEFVGSSVSPIINEAQILESRIYIERRGPTPHRKIFLNVRERGGESFWLMLERRPTSRVALVKGCGVTPQNDVVNRGSLILTEARG